MKLIVLIVRLLIGGLFVGHGTQKLFGWFGGYGPDGTGGYMESLGMKPGRQHALAGNRRMPQIAKGLGRGLAWRRHVAVDADHFPRARRRHQDGKLAADCVHMRIDHALHQGGGAGRIHRIAALTQHFDAGQGGAVMFAGDGAAPAEQARIEGRLLGRLRTKGAGAFKHGF